MFIQVEPQSIRTKEYKLSIINQFISKAPLLTGKIIDIKVSRGSTLFPEITEVSGDLGYDEMRKASLSNRNKRWTYSFPSYGQDENSEIRDKEYRDYLRERMLIDFTRDIIDEAAVVKTYDVDQNNPQDIIINFQITNPQILYKKAKELGIKFENEDELDLDDNISEAKFYLNPPRIKWHGKTIEISSDSIQVDICRIAFDRAIGETIEVIEIIEAIDRMRDKHDPKDYKSVYDAAYELNTLTYKALERKLFTWTRKAFYRNA